jgi:hypothetical protein
MHLSTETSPVRRRWCRLGRYAVPQPRSPSMKMCSWTRRPTSARPADIVRHGIIVVKFAAAVSEVRKQSLRASAARRRGDMRASDGTDLIGAITDATTGYFRAATRSARACRTGRCTLPAFEPAHDGSSACPSRQCSSAFVLGMPDRANCDPLISMSEIIMVAFSRSTSPPWAGFESGRRADCGCRLAELYDDPRELS